VVSNCLIVKCSSPPFALIWMGRYDRKRKAVQRAIPFEAYLKPSAWTRQSHGLMAFFLRKPHYLKKTCQAKITKIF